MRRVFRPFAIACAAALTLTACQKDTKEATAATNGVSEATLAKISALGFSTENARKVDNGYLVEGDIVLTEENLSRPATSPTLLIANEEQYRTTNLVKVSSGTRNITISVSGTLAGLKVWSDATDEFIRRYNALGLQITLSRVSSGGNVDIVGFNEGPSGGYITLGSSGFPDAAGNPYPQIKMNTNTQAYGSNPNQGYITSVLQHELGHCIGFRHTDYFNRALSCGGRKSNERAGTIGAILIPGTPSGFDSESFMLACSAGTDRTFNANDVKALNTLY